MSRSPVDEALEVVRAGGLVAIPTETVYGLAAPSANRFGMVSPTTAEHVRADLGDLVDFVLDGGACPIGVESTIVDCTVTPAQILRPGGIPSEQVEHLLDGQVAAASGPSRAAGMLASHYAPNARVILAESRAEAAVLLADLEHAELIDRTDDLVDYARHLYADLRTSDERGARVVVAVLPPAIGLGHAIRDRLGKAAAHR